MSNRLGRSFFGTVFFLVATVFAPPTSWAQSADELAGLWKAQRLYGPRVHGALIITKERDAYVAEPQGCCV